MSIHEEQTLHDFVLNLLNDASARAAFADDPTHVLSCAGLGDINAQDVQEVVPLVMDFNSLPAAGSLPVGAEGLEGAIAQLRSVADAGEQRADLGDLGAPDLGSFDLGAHGDSAGLMGTGEFASDQLEGAGGLAAGTEGGALASAVSSEAGELTGTATASIDGAAGSLSWAGVSGTGELTGELTSEGAHLGSSSDSALGHVAAVGGGGLEGSSGGGLSVDSLAGSGNGTADLSLDGATTEMGFESAQGEGAAFGAASTSGAAGGVALGSDDLGLEGSLAGAPDAIATGGSLASPFGTYGAEFTGEPETPTAPELGTTGDLGGALDSDALSRGSESAASTVATYVTSNGAALGAVPVDVPAAPELPADTGSLPVDVPADVPADLPANLPTDAAEGARSALPDTGSLPADVPAELPTGDLPADVPTDLPADLPSDLPQLPVANPLPSADDVRSGIEQGVQDNPVTDAVGSSPLGDVAHNHLPVPEQAPSVGDLDLGM